MLRAWQPEFSGQRREKGCTEQRPETYREPPLEASAGDRAAHEQEETTEAGTGPLERSSGNNGRRSHRTRSRLCPRGQCAGPSNTQGTQEDPQKDATYTVGKQALDQGPVSFFYKGQIANVSGFAGHVSLTHPSTLKTATDS